MTDPDRDGAGDAAEGGARGPTAEGHRDAETSAVEIGDAPAPGGGSSRPDTRPGATAGTGRTRTWHRRVPQVLGLALVWVLLWGSLSPPTIVGGLLIGVLVTLLFPLPLMPEPLPVRPVKVLRLLGFLIRDLVVSGIRVGMVTLVHPKRATSGVIGMPLCTRSDRTATAIITACALSPGSFTLQIDRDRRRWYVYAIGLRRAGAVERVRTDMMALQMRVVDAVGSVADVETCRAAVLEVAEGRHGGGSGPR